jgi:hypothetical protein
MRLPTYAEHRRFCEVDGWQDKGTARSRKGKGDHHRYTKSQPAGPPLYTRVSHGSGQYGSADTWKHILRDQLRVTEDEFWQAVDHDIPPQRQKPAPQPPKPEGEAIPLWLVQSLKHLVGLPEAQIASMTPDEAEVVYLEWCSKPVPGEDSS